MAKEKTGSFLTDVKKLRERARKHIEQGAVTAGYKANRPKMIAVLNEVRRQWIRSFDAACAAPRTPETKAKIACLLQVRDDVAESVASDNMSRIYPLAPAVAMCDPDVENIELPEIEIDLPGFEIPRPPEPPSRP